MRPEETSQQPEAATRAERADRGRGALGGWWTPAGTAFGVALLMTLAAGMVRLPGPGSDGLGAVASDGVGPAVPELVVTRVDLLPEGGEVRESLRLLDPTPLFLPDGRATGGGVNPEGMADRPDGEAGASFPAALVYAGQGPTKEILRPRPPATPLAASEAVSSLRWFEGMARADAPTRAGAESAAGAVGRLDVYRVGEADLVASLALPADPVLMAQIWRPLEMGVLLDAAGVIAAPVLTRGSGVGEVDERVRLWVEREALARLRLRPGAYRLVAGP